MEKKECTNILNQIGHRRFHISWFVFIGWHWEMSNIDIWKEEKVDEGKRIEKSTFTIIW